MTNFYLIGALLVLLPLFLFLFIFLPKRMRIKAIAKNICDADSVRFIGSGFTGKWKGASIGYNTLVGASENRSENSSSFNFECFFLAREVSDLQFIYEGTPVVGTDGPWFDFDIFNMDRLHFPFEGYLTDQVDKLRTVLKAETLPNAVTPIRDVPGFAYLLLVGLKQSRSELKSCGLQVARPFYGEKGYFLIRNAFSFSTENEVTAYFTLLQRLASVPLS